MKKVIPFFVALAVAIFFLSKTKDHFISDSSLRAKVHETFKERMDANDGILKQFFQIGGEDLTTKEREALEETIRSKDEVIERTKAYADELQEKIMAMCV